MRGHTRWLILACATVALIGAHTVPLYYLVTHKVVTASVAVSVLAMVLLKHLGVITLSDHVCTRAVLEGEKIAGVRARGARHPLALMVPTLLEQKRDPLEAG